MLCRLIVLRHAKSAWDTDAPSDHARPLNKRGRKDAPRVAARLVALGWCPQYVLSSDSVRTRQTWALMEELLGEGTEVTFDARLYHGGLVDVRHNLAKLSTVTTAMVIGHNPGWEDMVSRLVRDDLRMTTCNAALLSLTADSWRQALARDGGWTLEELIRPKALR